MQLNLSGHHLDITSAIRQHASDKLTKIKHHFDNVMNVSINNIISTFDIINYY